jgi:hypothetical protein
MKSRLFVFSVLIFMMQFVLVESNAFALDDALKVANPKNLVVVVESVDEDGGKIGITAELIRAKAELQLKRNGVISVTKNDANITDGFLYIRISMIRNVYILNVQFQRLVIYIINNEKNIVKGTV